MSLQSIYVANGIGIAILVVLYYVSRVRILRRRVEDRVYSTMVFGVMLACFTEAFSYTIDGRLFPGARLLNYACNTYLYTVNLFLSFLLLVYVDLGLYGDIGRIWKHYKPQIIIALVMFTTNVVNLFVPVSFYLTADNVYHRTPVSYVYYFIILYYCLSATVLTKRYEKKNGAKSFFNINLFLIPIIVGGGLQFMFYGLSLAWLSSAIGLMGLYMMQQNEIAYIDPLTDLYNRQYLAHILSAWINRGVPFSGAMLDIDRFKRINDNHGHSEGDKAIQTVGEVLRRSRQDHELVFRFAGDEFIVLRMGDGEGMDAYLQRVLVNLEQINREAPLYRLALSYGTSRFDSGTIDSFMKDMDRQMYAMKARHHGEGAGEQ